MGKPDAWRDHHSAPPTRGALLAYGFVRGAIMLFARLYWRLSVTGTERLPPDGSYVVAPGAHRSNLDTLVAARITRRRLRYMGKDTLWRYGWSAWFLSAMGGFPVHRDSPDREALKLLLDVVDGGEPVVMFPEGTRGSGPEVGDLYDGPAYVACRKQIPLVPVGIGGSERAMPVGARIPRPARMALVVGAPIQPPVSESGRVPRRAVRELSERLKSELQVLFDEAQEIVGHPNRHDGATDT